jgi:hypothetical protein
MNYDLIYGVNEAKALVESPVINPSTYIVDTDLSLPIIRWVRWMNASQQYIQNQMIKANEDYLGKMQTINIVSGTDTYAINADSIKLRLIERTDTTPYTKLLPLGIVNRSLMNTVQPYNYTNWFTFWGNNLIITPTPTTSNTLYVWYIKKMCDLHLAEASSVGATSIVFPSTTTWGDIRIQNDYYNGARLLVVSATTGAGQIVEITDYDGVTRTATVAWDSAYGQPTGTVVYCILSEIPEQHAQVLWVRTAITSQIKDKDTESNNSLLPFYNEIEKDMKSSLEERQTQESVYVKTVYNIDDNVYLI